MYTLSVLTGTRADYGLLRPVLRHILACNAFALRLLVTGSHLSAAFGETVREIEADGIPIAARLDILSPPAPAGRAGTAERTLLAERLFLDELTAHRPDALLLLGDRYEAFAAATAAALLDIPVVHISGGEVTAGADDEWFRHCISKMARLHFPSCELHRRRLLRMGEAPEVVHNVGGLGDENIRSMELLPWPALAADLGIPPEQRLALVTFHPETATGLAPDAQAEALLRAIEQSPGLFWLFTAANADAGGETLNAALSGWAAAHPADALFVPSLGVLRYLSAMQSAALVLGNSSSGVVETPSFGVPTVNIGRRQEGRMLCDNVLCCPLEAGAIAEAIAHSQTLAFRQRAASTQSPYNGGDTSGHIMGLLLGHLADGSLTRPKRYYDGKEPPL